MKITGTDITPEEQADFRRWIESPVNEHEFRRMLNLVTLLQDLPRSEQSFEPVGERAGWLRWMDGRTRRFRTLIYATCAAAALGIGAALFMAVVPPSTGGGTGIEQSDPVTFVTEAGQPRLVTLQDGSLASLNAETKLTWASHTDYREVRLVSGEALFEVTPNSAKPFHVRLENGDIRVTGTRFNVRRSPEGIVTVTVLSGTVEVRGMRAGGSATPWHRVLTANQEMSYRAGELLEDVRRIYTSGGPRTVERTPDRFTFQNEPLWSVLAELARHSTKPIVLTNPDDARWAVSGALNVVDVVRSLRNMQSTGMIHVTDEPDRIVVLANPDSAKR